MNKKNVELEIPRKKGKIIIIFGNSLYNNIKKWLSFLRVSKKNYAKTHTPTHTPTVEQELLEIFSSRYIMPNNNMQSLRYIVLDDERVWMMERLVQVHT